MIHKEPEGEHNAYRCTPKQMWRGILELLKCDSLWTVSAKWSNWKVLLPLAHFFCLYYHPSCLLPVLPYIISLIDYSLNAIEQWGISNSCCKWDGNKKLIIAEHSTSLWLRTLSWNYNGIKADYFLSNGNKLLITSLLHHIFQGCNCY